MKPEQIERFVMRYLEAEGCRVIEKGPAHTIVKLSPAADKALTGRPFYWSFVERTGAPAETMTFTFVFDPQRHAAETEKAKAAAEAKPAPPAPDTILGRYFGYVPPAAMGRMPKEDVTFGSRKLEQIFAAVRGKGRFVRLFEEPAMPASGHGYASPTACDTWFLVNYQVELACDMKRDEIHSLAIDLITGEIAENFYERVKGLKLSPRLPPNVHVPPAKCTLQRASFLLDSFLERKLQQYDHTWAHEATLRLSEELERIAGYYTELLQTPEEEKRREAEAHYQRRREELDWQYAPRIGVSVINCGLFHLLQPAVRRF